MLLSGGTVKLASANPFDKPLIDPNFLTTTFDTAAIVQSVTDALTFMSAAPWQKDFKPVPWGDLAKAKTDAQKLAFARNNAVNVNHPVGTARMASSAKGGVVDSQLRLKGGDGLRVVDASIFVSTPTTLSNSRPSLLIVRLSSLLYPSAILKLLCISSLNVLPTSSSTRMASVNSKVYTLSFNTVVFCCLLSSHCILSSHFSRLYRTLCYLQWDPCNVRLLGLVSHLHTTTIEDTYHSFCTTGLAFGT